MTYMGVFNQFDLVYAMVGSNGGPNYSADVLGTFFSRTPFGGSGGQMPQMGLSASIATMTFLLIAKVVGFLLYLNHILTEEDVIKMNKNWITKLVNMMINVD